MPPCAAGARRRSTAPVRSPAATALRRTGRSDRKRGARSPAESGAVIANGDAPAKRRDLDRAVGRVELRRVVEQVGDRPFQERALGTRRTASSVGTGSPTGPATDPLAAGLHGLGQPHRAAGSSDDRPDPTRPPPRPARRARRPPCRGRRAPGPHLSRQSACRRSTSTFVRRLVSGVRSSWPASGRGAAALRRRRQGAEHRQRTRGRAGPTSSPGPSTATCDVEPTGRGDLLGRGGEVPKRAGERASRRASRRVRRAPTAIPPRCRCACAGSAST